MKKQSLILATFLALGSVAVNGQETLTPPYTQWFDSLSGLTVIDNNNDGNTWKAAYEYSALYSSAARYSSNSNIADEWIITPAFEFKAGYTYKLSFNAVGANACTNNLEVKIGNAPKVDAMTTSVIGQIELTEKVKNAYNGEISVTSDGTYYLGIHLTAEASQGIIYVDDLKIEAGLLGAAPAAVSAFTATPAVEEAKAVMKLSFTAPDKTNSGAELTEITNIMVYRGTEKIADLGAATPGAEVTYTDITPVVGNNTYKVICVNTAGEGSEATVSKYISFTTPSAPTNVVLTETEEGQTITWDAVTTGANASYLFIPENVTYTITRSDKVEIAKGITECTVTDTYTKDDEGQNLIYYTVTAVNEGGSSSATSSNKILVGNPYTGEYAESFANYSYSTTTWQAESGWVTKTSSPYNPAISADQDGNNGFVGFSSYSSGTTARLVSPIINVSEMQNPRLSFYVYHAATTYTDKVVPELLINGEYTELCEGITVNGDVEGWTKYNFDLTKEQVAGDFQLSFKAVAGGGYLVAIDNITIKDALAYNLAATGITVPASLGVGKAAEIAVSIKNTGVNAAAGYKVVLYCNDEEVSSINGEELASEAANDSILFTYTATPFMAGKELEFSAEIVYTNDLNAEDNTVSVSVPVVTNDLPVPTDLKATETPTTITLTWTAPVVPEVQVQPVMTESFEEWTAGSTDAFADWTFVDGDGKNISGYVGYGSSIPMAFMTSNNSKIRPNTGSNYLVSPKNNSYRDYRDDWAISPEVVGGQTISFFVCQLGGYGMFGTTFEVCYSSTDNNVESFVVLESKKHTATSWVEYSFTLPENAKYFAIHVIDNGDSTGDALAFDDITFQPGSVQLVHTGYNVYRDEKMIATIDDKAVATFTDTQLDDVTLEYSYAVSALYETGESLASDVLKLSNPVTGIDEIIGNQAVIANDGMLKVTGFAGKQLNVYNAGGQAVVAKAIANDVETIALSNGVYIVSIANKNFKVVIK